jgi:hypothetical protein
MRGKIVKILLMVFLLALLIPRYGSGIQHEHMHRTAEPDCLIDKGPCVKILEDQNIQVLLDINPKPVKVMTDLVFTVNLNKSGDPVTDANITLDLTMPGMFMGINRPAMKHRKNGTYEGKGVIPVCPHGGTIWKADVTVKRDGESETVSYIFEVKQ